MSQSTSSCASNLYNNPRTTTLGRDCQRDIIYFQSQPAMRLIVDAKCDMRDLCKRLMVELEGEDALDYGGVSPEKGSSSSRMDIQSKLRPVRVLYADNYILYYW
ncbi:hypothetical protein EDB84DRAFT_1571772 [Lactarius hengduanensis]|nr:hypothetical protein EDB84DRAFT_1571772 [Lactarius hengduanensis]